MKVGTSVPLPAYTIDPAFMAKKAEDLGFDSIWYAEHPAVPVHSESSFPATGGDIPWTYSHFTEPYIALARASAVTSTIKLGTGITLVPERHPLLLAKEVAALGPDAIHSVTNPVSGLTGALHVYGGNFFETPRSEWDPVSLHEGTYDVAKNLRLFEESNQLLETA